MKIAHAWAVSILSSAWFMAALWLWPHAAQAGTLSSDFGLYDWVSLGYAALLGLMGGMLALIVALASDRRVVMQVLKEGLRNALVSPIAGMAAYLLVDALNGIGWVTLPSGGRFLVIVGGGWAGIAFFVWARETAGKASVVLGDWLVRKGRP
jgi:hypothetical protein